LTQKHKEFLAAIEPHKGIIFKVSKVYFDLLEDQEDLRQEIIYQLWHSFHSFRNESQFSTWMYRIALNTAILFFKKERNKSEKLKVYENESKLPIENVDAEDDNLKLLYSSFQYLDKIEKALIYMFLEDLSHREIASNLGISEANARVKLHRTKEKIKSIIKNKGI